MSQIADTGAAPISWAAPAGGCWELETVHVAGAQPLVFQERAPAAFKEGFQRIGPRYGFPIDHLDMRFVNDHCYARMRVVGAPEPKPGRAAGPPPAAVLKVLTRLHPELRRRAKAARRALATRAWRRDLERWESVLRDEVLARGRSLQAVAVEQLDDAGLVEHLRQVGDHFQEGVALHMELMPVHNLPVGRLLLAGRGWGLDDAAVFDLFVGSSPASTASSRALAGIAAACQEAGVSPTSLDEVRSASPLARAALDDYLADHAWRVVTEYTPKGRALIEFPEALVQAIGAAGRGSGEPPHAPDIAAVRERVPASERARFDDLVEDARRCYGARDDNVGLTFMWPVGLLRRALLEVGRRLVERGTVPAAQHAFWLGEAEIPAALGGAPGLGAVASARAARAAASEADGAPLRLGVDEGPPPPSSLFPAAMAELVDALLVGFELEAAPGATWSGTGVGIGASPYTGRACVAASPGDALALLEPGDVLVTSVTTPAFEAVMAIAGAVVTDQGGLMGHTAIQCREHGIPALVGVAGATAHIVHGSQVTVDPAAGQVRLSA